MSFVNINQINMLTKRSQLHPKTPLSFGENTHLTRPVDFSVEGQRKTVRTQMRSQDAVLGVVTFQHGETRQRRHD